MRGSLVAMRASENHHVGDDVGIAPLDVHTCRHTRVQTTMHSRITVGVGAGATRTSDGGQHAVAHRCHYLLHHSPGPPSQHSKQPSRGRRQVRLCHGLGAHQRLHCGVDCDGPCCQAPPCTAAAAAACAGSRTSAPAFRRRCGAPGSRLVGTPAHTCR